MIVASSLQQIAVVAVDPSIKSELNKGSGLKLGPFLLIIANIVRGKNGTTKNGFR